LHRPQIDRLALVMKTYFLHATHYNAQIRLRRSSRTLLPPTCQSSRSFAVIYGGGPVAHLECVPENSTIGFSPETGGAVLAFRTWQMDASRPIVHQFGMGECVRRDHDRPCLVEIKCGSSRSDTQSWFRFGWSIESRRHLPHKFTHVSIIRFAVNLG